MLKGMGHSASVAVQGQLDDDNFCYHRLNLFCSMYLIQVCYTDDYFTNH